MSAFTRCFQFAASEMNKALLTVLHIDSYIQVFLCFSIKASFITPNRVTYDAVFHILGSDVSVLSAPLLLSFVYCIT